MMPKTIGLSHKIFIFTSSCLEYQEVSPKIPIITQNRFPSAQNIQKYLLKYQLSHRILIFTWNSFPTTQNMCTVYTRILIITFLFTQNSFPTAQNIQLLVHLFYSSCILQISRLDQDYQLGKPSLQNPFSSIECRFCFLLNALNVKYDDLLSSL